MTSILSESHPKLFRQGVGYSALHQMEETHMNKEQRERLDERIAGKNVTYRLEPFDGRWQLARDINGRLDTWRTLTPEQLDETIGH